MRCCSLVRTFASLLIALLTACSSAEMLPLELQGALTQEAAQKFASACPINTPQDAAVFALKQARNNGPMQRVGAQRVTSVQPTTFAEAQAQLYAIGISPQKIEPPDTPIWLVEMEGMWVISPPNSPRAAYNPRYFRVTVAVKAVEPCALTMAFRAREVDMFDVE